MKYCFKLLRRNGVEHPSVHIRFADMVSAHLLHFPLIYPFIQHRTVHPRIYLSISNDAFDHFLLLNASRFISSLTDYKATLCNFLRKGVIHNASF